jgi:sugar lactone lactonase YvrE
MLRGRRGRPTGPWNEVSSKLMETKTLLDGLAFGEGPRWHDGRLWFSDMHDHWVLAVDGDGNVQKIVEVPNRPSGLGWRPDGTLLIVSMTDRRLLAYDGTGLSEVADISSLASHHCNDMVVDASGRAYIGNFGFDLDTQQDFQAAQIVRVDPDGSARVAADTMAFPNGTVITPDGKTLIVGETFGGQLTAFDIDADGDLSNRRQWAAMPEGAVADGICLDEAGGIWVASPTSNDCIRLEEGGNVSHRIVCDQGVFACMLGGEDGKSLFILTAPSSSPEECRSARGGKIEVATAPHAGAGLP